MATAVETALLESEERFKSILESTNAGYFFIDADGIIRDVNAAWVRLYKYGAKEEVIGKHFSLIQKIDDIEKAHEVVEGIMRGDARYLTGEFSRKCRDGSIGWHYFSARNVLRAGALIGIEGLVIDTTERKLAEAAIKKSEEKFSKVFKTCPEAILIASISDGKYIDVNDVFLKKTGFLRSEVIGHSSAELQVWVDPMQRRRYVEELTKKGSVKNFEVLYRMRSGEVRCFLVSGEIIELEGEPCSLSFIFDITDRKRLEEELQKTQKLESLGILAGGIAHDFNNLMGGIFGYIDMAREQSADSILTSYLTRAMNAIDRARGLTAQLLTFAKGGAPVLKAADLFPFVKDAARFALSGSNVSCRVTIEDGLWPCTVDLDQIVQVIDNIVINAQQAMPGGGVIEIAAQNISLGENGRPGLSKGKYVKLSVEDRGTGISKELLSRIFDPFYTTKTKGHGLGLSTCYSIISRHGGAIDVESEPGKGSKFTLYLPASPEPACASEAANAPVAHHGSGTVIVMDDELIMREIIGTMLESLGYTALCVSDGKAALERFQGKINDRTGVVALVLDLTVPGGMGGVEAVAEVRTLDKKVPIFVASGYADDPVMKNPTEFGFTASICKPFKKIDLAEMLEKHLNLQGY